MDDGPSFTRRPGCDPVTIPQAEARLGVELPAGPAAFLLSCDGIDDEWGYHAAWSLEQIVEENLRRWSDASLPLPRDLLGIGGDGADDWFCVTLPEGMPIHHGWIGREPAVIATDVRSLWQGWQDGSILV